MLLVSMDILLKPNYFDVVISLLFCVFILLGVLNDKITYYLISMEIFALLMLAAYKWPKFSIMTELADSFAYVAFWPKSRKWLLALFIGLNSIIVSELMNTTT